MRCDHAATVADPVRWELLTERMPHHRHAEALWAGLVLRNCVACKSTISRPMGGDMAEYTQDRVKKLLDEIRAMGAEPPPELEQQAVELAERPDQTEEAIAMLRDFREGRDVALPLGVRL